MIYSLLHKEIIFVCVCMKYIASIVDQMSNHGRVEYNSVYLNGINCVINEMNKVKL